MRNKEKKSLWALVGLVFLFLGGCATTKVYQPSSTVVPQIAALPETDVLPMRTVPGNEKSVLRIPLPMTANVPPEDDFVNSPSGVKLSEDENYRPSVIISVPLVGNKNASDVDESKAQSKELYATDEFYNIAEQQIEKELIRKRFRVLDRSKFEAKLRDMRDVNESFRSSWWWQDYREQASTLDKDDIKKLLEEDYENGKFSDMSDYLSALSELQKQATNSSAGRNRAEDSMEMIDISEVIRAAQLGENQGDFVLLINNVEVKTSFDRSLSLRNMAEARRFVDANDGLNFGSDSKSEIPSIVRTPWFRAEFNAKLVAVKTGAIVWIGSHEIDSRVAENFDISFDVERVVSNADTVGAAIRGYNDAVSQRKMLAMKARNQLELSYQEASKPREFDSQEAVDAYKLEIKQRVDSSLRAYEKALSELKQVAKSLPLEMDKPWEYEYVVSGPFVTPVLTSMDDNNIREAEMLKAHKVRLIKGVTKGLIKTIELLD